MKTISVMLLLIVAAPVLEVRAQDLSSEVAELRQLLVEMQDDYQSRISDLEVRLERAERLASGAKREAEDAFEVAEQTAIDQSSGSSSANTFNPALGAVLSARYAVVDQSWDEIPGFMPSGEIGTGESGFALGEAEINLKSNVDSAFFGNLTFALHEEDGAAEIELEEAWVQTTGLPAGLSLTGGRLFSGAGYLNQFHRHADDFADRPLPYQAFLGGQYRVDGIQARWVAPTSLLFEMGTELNWGGGFPATENGETSPSAWTLFAKLGGDAGISNSWQLGFSWVAADAVDRGAGHHDAEADPATFSGDSDLAVVDFVWKWAPNGNTNSQNFKLQGEYFSRSERGLIAEFPYDGDQMGWYLQGVWQFVPRWRVGLRHDEVDANNGPLLAAMDLEDPGRSSSRDSLMLDWSPSEFSRLRLEYINDRVLPQTDHQWLLQYIMSVGAHRAHAY